MELVIVGVSLAGEQDHSYDSNIHCTAASKVGTAMRGKDTGELEPFVNDHTKA